MSFCWKCQFSWSVTCHFRMARNILWQLVSIKTFSEVCWVGHWNTCCTSRGRQSKLLFLCWTNCKWATASHRWKQTWNPFLTNVGFGVFQWSHGCHPISLECTCSLRKAKAETPQETPAAAEASNCNIWSWLELWFGLGKCQANVIELWHCESLSAILSRDLGLLSL